MTSSEAQVQSKRKQVGLTGYLGIILCLFTLVEVNYPQLTPPSQLAIFLGLGLVLCYLRFPAFKGARRYFWARTLDPILACSSALVSLYVVVQTEPFFQARWLAGQSLGNRAGQEETLDLVVGAVGLALTLEATRRSIGWVLALLSLVFGLYAFAGPWLPDWLLPHRGYDLERIVSQTFLHSQGVFGIALNVIFTYVLLFVVLGSLLELSGATQFIIQLASRIFRGSPGGPAKVAVLSSGLMGSLSGSAVANTATTGTFTIPMMRSAGLKAHVAAGVEAAASSGGALAPPVMGAAAYMMLELVQPPVTYLQIIRAALLPAILYYLSLLFVVHLISRREKAAVVELPSGSASWFPVEGWIFSGALGSLLLFLLAGYTPFRAVTLSFFVIVAVSWSSKRTRMNLGRLGRALARAAASATPLICAAACVGVIIGVVTLTGLGSKLPALILPFAEQHLVAALLLIMVCSIILGMGLPSAVCYLLMATFVGPALDRLGVIPLAAHLFIFYFGMMSMVTPPVALAAYAAAAIAKSKIMATAWAAFRFALVGFALPYMFVFRPQLLLLAPDGTPISFWLALPSLAVSVLGVFALAAAISGYLWSRLSRLHRMVLLTASILLFYPAGGSLLSNWGIFWTDLSGAVLFVIAAAVNYRLTAR